MPSSRVNELHEPIILKISKTANNPENEKWIKGILIYIQGSDIFKIDFNGSRDIVPFIQHLDAHMGTIYSHACLFREQNGMTTSFHHSFFFLCIEFSLVIIVSFTSLFLRELPAVPYPVKASYPAIYSNLGSKLIQCGHFEKAIWILTEASRIFQKNGQYEELGYTFIKLSRAYQSIGEYHKSIENSGKALSLSSKSKNRTLSAQAYANFGRIYADLGEERVAESFLKRGLRIAQEEKNNRIMASILSDLGSVYVKLDEHTKAINTYDRALKMAEKFHHHALIAHINSNKVKIYISEKCFKEARQLLEGFYPRYLESGYSHDMAFGLINIAQAYRCLYTHHSGSESMLRSRASHILTKASEIAEAINDRYAMSYAFGYLGQIYEDEKEYEKALYYTRMAIFSAQQIPSPESLYLWHWQLGRLFRSLDKVDAAISAQREAIATLESIRHQNLPSCEKCKGPSSLKGIESIYFELADLLLQKAAISTEKKEGISSLMEARDTIERLKSVELQNYFQDPCLGAYESKMQCIDTISDQTAVVYIIPFEERLDLILTLPGEMEQFSVQIANHVLEKEVRNLRKKLEKRTTREYLIHAQNLYDDLIRPFANQLISQKIGTLVFIPDASLRSIPMSALHDGRHFLIENFAIAYTLSLQLTDPKPIQRRDINFLLAGVTQPVHGFPSLLNADYEIQTIHEHFGGTLLLNQDFLIPNLKHELRLKPYSIVHIVSHGVFKGMAPESFILTWDGKIAMNLLDHLVSPSRYRKNPIDLLTLSACQTATGDDLATLGLAGIAIKAGARSTLGTLWHIDDQASSELIIEFYKQLKNPLTSKAKALQVAQLQLMRDDRFRHPCYWAPFLIIGNWL